jgi:hypothetical protein
MNNIYLISNASLDIYPENSLTSFTNELPYVINTPKSENWGICLRYITLSELIIEDIKTDNIFVQCTNIDDNREINVGPKILASFAYKPDSNNLCHHQFNQDSFFPLDNSILNNITIRLLDDYGNPIILKNGQATIVKITVGKMAKEEIIFHVSSERTDQYMDNTSSDFTVDFPYTDRLIGNWEVGLTSITHPTKAERLFTEPQYILLYDLNKYSTDYIPYVYTLDGPFSTILDLIKALSDIYLKTNHNFKLRITNHPPYSSYIWTRIEYYVALSPEIYKLLNYSTVPQYENMGIGMDCMRDFGKLNLSEEYLTRLKTSSKKSRVITSEHVDFFRKYFALPLIPEEMIILNPPLLQMNYSEEAKNMLIYTDFTKSSILGSRTLPILKILPLLGNSEDVHRVTHDFYQKEYHELSNTFLTKLSFKITGAAGEKINYGYQNNVRLTLSFCKKT